jgi:ubiquinone/menaquinone biosynthesis C-methylase UbiE
VSAYDAIARWYDEWVSESTDEDPYFPPAAALMGEVAGQQICDLACGQGRVARRLAEMGARVVGVDLSGELLKIAHRHEEREPRGILYVQADARKLDGLAAGSFDGVLCNLALMDISDLTPTLHGVARILRSGGWFVFSILHPCYHTARCEEVVLPAGLAWAVAGYFTEGYWRSEKRTGPPGKVGAYHRMLSTYVNSLTDAGLLLERMIEVRATGSLAETRPVWTEVPAILVARCRRA